MYIVYNILCIYMYMYNMYYVLVYSTCTCTCTCSSTCTNVVVLCNCRLLYLSTDGTAVSLWDIDEKLEIKVDSAGNLHVGKDASVSQDT